jgi:hypothetical protein
VVNVSDGSCDGLGDVVDGAGGLVVEGAEGVAITVRGVGTPTVPLVVALSPLWMMTAVRIAPRAMTMPTIAAAGRHRRSAGHNSS